MKSKYLHLSEMSPYIACVMLGIILSGLLVKDIMAQKASERKALASLKLQVKSSDVLGIRKDFWGSPNAQYTLVEFGDYECPPCRGHQKPIEEIIKALSGQIKLDFRHIPLTKIHPHAMDAAILAEASRIKGNFWDMHRQLFSTDLANKKIFEKEKDSSILDRAKKQVADDMKLASSLGIQSTPTFLLVTPSGQVFRVPNLEILKKML